MAAKRKTIEEIHIWQNDYDKGLTIRNIVKKYGIAKQTALKYLNTRTKSEAAILSGSHGCCSWSKEKRSQVAKQQGFGGYRENAGRSKKFRVLDSFGNRTVLQSTYELECSIILDDLDIKWIRPKALKYNEKNYFADFYLVDYDIYLDPKNNYKAKQDKEKIKAVIDENNVSIFVLSKEQITKDFISGLIA